MNAQKTLNVSPSPSPPSGPIEQKGRRGKFLMRTHSHFQVEESLRCQAIDYSQGVRNGGRNLENDIHIKVF